METIGAILAGGQSTRFGSPKCRAPLGDVTLIEWVLSAQKAVFDDVIIVTNDPESFADLGVPLVADSPHGPGPLSGIHAALTHADGKAIALSPCDAPYAVPDYYRLLLRSNDAVDAVFPRSHGPLGYEPLFGWLAPEVLPPLTTFLQSSERAVHRFVDSLPRVRYLTVGEIAPRGVEQLFMNVNTRDDMQRAEDRLPRGTGT